MAPFLKFIATVSTHAMTQDVHKRKRPSLVCDNCKRKKIKCDKGLPCVKCVKAGLGDSCAYDASSQRLAARRPPRENLPYVMSAKKPVFSNSRQTRLPPVNETKPEQAISMTELEILKERLRQIEASLQRDDPSGTDTSSDSSRTQNSVSSENMRLTVSSVSSTSLGGAPHSATPPGPAKANPVVSAPQEASNETTSPKRVPPTCTDYIGINPYSRHYETINFYEDVSTLQTKGPLRRINFGPLAWTSLLRRDAGLNLVWQYLDELREQELRFPAALKRLTGNTGVFAGKGIVPNQEDDQVIFENNEDEDGVSSTNNPERAFRKRALEPDGYEDMIPYKRILKARAERNMLRKATLNNISKSRLEQNDLTLGLTFYDRKVDRELQIIDKIEAILPKRKVIWLLIRRYFEWLYQFMPFIDEASFRSDVAKIIGEESLVDESPPELKAEKKLDLALIGLLFIVIRLAYLSLFCNKAAVNEENLTTTDPDPERQVVKYLMQNPINISTVDVAHLCLEQFQMQRKSYFTVLQLAIYVRLYHIYAPEDGEAADGGDSQVLSASIIQMAYSLGLNRDPDNFPELDNPRLNNISRKIWLFLVMSDFHNAHSFGNPLTTNAIYYDTKVPFWEPGNENHHDTEKDRLITEIFGQCSRMYPYFATLLPMILNVNDGVQIKDLCVLLDEFEYVTNLNLGTMLQMIHAPHDVHGIYNRNYRVKVYLSTQAFLLSIYFIFFNFYEKRDPRLSHFFLKKCLLLSMLDIMPHYYSLLGNSSVVCDMMINPTLEQSIHKSNQVHMAAITRINSTIYHCRMRSDHQTKLSTDKEYARYYQALCRLSSGMTRCAEVAISAISKISNRYYYAWRITKGHTLLLQAITSTQFYRLNAVKTASLVLEFTVDQIEGLDEICEIALDKLGNTSVCNSLFCTQLEQEVTGTMSNNIDYPKVSSKMATKYPERTPVPFTPEVNSIEKDLGFDNIDNKEVDKLWLRMLSVKDENVSLFSNSQFDDGLGLDSRWADPTAYYGKTVGAPSPMPQTTSDFDVNYLNNYPPLINALAEQQEFDMSAFDIFNEL